MKKANSIKYKAFLYFLISIYLIPYDLFSQPACPTVSVAPASVSICSGCTTLTATVQGTVATTSYSVAPTPYFPFPFTGTPVLVNIDDTWSDTVSLPFCFEFYGATYSKCIIGSNAVISFDLSNAGGFNTWAINNATPSSTPPDLLNSIMGPWIDIDPSVGGNIYFNTYGTAPCRAFVISWNQIPMFSCNSLIFTGQIVLYETTNIIDVYIQNNPTCTTWNGGAAIEGIQNATGTQAVSVPGRNYPAQWVVTNDGQRFTPTGTPQYNLTWYAPPNINIGSAPTITVCPTSTTTYTATVVNNTCNGPITVSSAATVNYGGISSLNITSTSTPCSGIAGTATAVPSGGTAPFTYLWTPGSQTTQTATGLSAGTYSVTVTDASGCSKSGTVVITTSPPVILTGHVSTNVNCFGNSTGSATVNVSGGTPPLTYSWNTTPVQTTQTASGLPAGSYTVIVTDAMGCSISDIVLITQPPLLTNSISAVVNVNCFGGNNGSATANGSGGTPSYTYSWSTSPVQTAQSATGLTAGNYTVTVTDAMGCSLTNTVQIFQPPLLSNSFSQVINVNCFGGNNGSATANGAGGTPSYSYSWNSSPVQTTQTATGLPAGSYTLIVTDAMGCTVSNTVLISSPTLLANSFSPVVNVSCFGGNNGSATANGSGGTPSYTYAWSTSPVQTAQSATGLSAGSYSLIVTDAMGCSLTNTVLISQPALLTNSFSPVVNVSCFGGSDGSATANGAGGTPSYTYQWNNTQTSQTATGLIAGNYSVTVSDMNGCSLSNTVAITEPTPLAHSFSAISGVDCFGNNTGGATSNASGGTPVYTYLWNSIPVQTTPTSTGLWAGVYTITVTDANGCSLADTVVISSPTGLTFFSPVITNVDCFGNSTGVASVSGTGGSPSYTYLWNPTAQTSSTATGLAAGVYTVTLTDNNGCIVKTQVPVTEPPLLTATTGQFNILCFGNNTGTATALPAGGTPSYTYLWNNLQSSATATGLSAGNYSVLITDSHGCMVTQTVSLTQPATAVTSSISAVNVLCNPDSTGSVTANPSGGIPGYSYLWDNGSTTSAIAGMPAGNYTVLITDQNGCTFSITDSVTQPPLLTASITPDTSICAGTFFTAAVTGSGGNPAYTYLWSTGDTTASLTAFPAGSSSYSASVTDANGCTTVIQTTTVTVVPLPTASITVTPGNVVLYPNTICFTGDTSTSTSWNWNFGDYTSSSGSYTACHDYANTGTFCVTLITANSIGCSDSAEACVSETEIVIPNVFSPNSDGTNEIFYISMPAYGLTYYSCKIYDRWGIPMAELHLPKQGWDGFTDAGTPASEGTYYYTATITYGKTTFTQSGYFTLVR